MALDKLNWIGKGKNCSHMTMVIEWIVFLIIFFSSTKWVRILAARAGIKREWALTPCVLSVIFLKSAIIYKATGLRSPIYLGNDFDLFYYGITIITMAAATILVGLGFIIEAIKQKISNRTRK